MQIKKIYLKEKGFRLVYVPFDFASGVYGNRKKQFAKKKKKQLNRSR